MGTHKVIDVNVFRRRQINLQIIFTGLLTLNTEFIKNNILLVLMKRNSSNILPIFYWIMVFKSQFSKGTEKESQQFKFHMWSFIY